MPGASVHADHRLQDPVTQEDPEWLEGQEAGDDIDAKLRAKGIGASGSSGANDVLARLKARQAG